MQVNFETISYELEEHIATITLQAPQKRNPLTTESTAELMKAMKLADEDPTVRVIILTGSGKAFCAGGDLREFQENLTKEVPQLHREGLESTELFKLGATIRTPIIASVNGAALGGGTGLVAMSHIAIASEKAKFGLTELKLGIVPFVIFPWVRRAVGNRRAMELMLSADIIDATVAHADGLVHRVVEHERLEKETMKVARQIASHSPLAVQLALTTYFETEQMDFLRSFDYLTTLRLVSFKSEDLQEGATAFLEKRQANWRGK